MPSIPNGFQYLPGHFSRPQQDALVHEIRKVTRLAPLFTPTMPRTGRPFSVRMTNCGPLGWVSSKDGGYRYERKHPETGSVWPPIPAALLALWNTLTSAAPEPEACLVNWYGPGAKLGLHVDQDEEDFSAPVISVSLGDDAWFRVGGLTRRAATQRFRLQSGDVVVLGGEARRIYHGIDRIVPGTSDLFPEDGRFNLTLRRVTLPDPV